MEKIIFFVFLVVGIGAVKAMDCVHCKLGEFEFKRGDCGSAKTPAPKIKCSAGAKSCRTFFGKLPDGKLLVEKKCSAEDGVRCGPATVDRDDLSKFNGTACICKENKCNEGDVEKIHKRIEGSGSDEDDNNASARLTTAALVALLLLVSLLHFL